MRVMRYQESIEAFQFALKIDPSHIDAHYHLSEVYRLQGKEKEAREEMKVYNKLKIKKTK